MSGFPNPTVQSSPFDMDLPTRPEDALSQPTRAQLFAALNELRRPAGTEELAERLGLHPNGIRLHLEQMREARLVARDRARHGRGRPRDMWTISPEARPGGEAPTGYADLGRWLARVVTSRKTSLRGVEAAGREIGRDLAPTDGGASPGESVYAAFVSLGFQPKREVGPEGSLQLPLPRRRAGEPAPRMRAPPRHHSRPTRCDRPGDEASAVRPAGSVCRRLHRCAPGRVG
jgi:predicted ArsR family transcriptional regulator